MVAQVEQVRQPAPAVWMGTQSGAGLVPDLDLYDLTADIEGHPAGSTVSGQTLVAAGYSLPAKVAPLPRKAPPVLVWREVVRHPAGGWTIAAPVDATRSTVRIYHGNWPRKAAALAALANFYTA